MQLEQRIVEFECAHCEKKNKKTISIMPANVDIGPAGALGMADKVCPGCGRKSRVMVRKESTEVTLLSSSRVPDEELAHDEQIARDETHAYEGYEE